MVSARVINASYMIGAVSHLHEALIMLDDMSFCHMSADVRKHARRWPFPPLVDSQLPQIDQPLGSTRLTTIFFFPTRHHMKRFQHVPTCSRQAYTSLLQTAPSASGTFLDEGPAMVRSATPDREEKAENSSLREEEAEVRPTAEMVSYYCRMGRWRNILNCCLIFFIQVYIYLLCDLVLATWTNKMSKTPEMDDRPYLFGYLFWLILGTIFWIICWTFGEFFTLRISAQIHGDVLRRILRAPIDRFFDKHPVGRIMNRLSADLSVVDLYLFMKATSTIAILGFVEGDFLFSK